ncbi:MAG: DMT family transporter [Thermoleophilaceae bacterium]
MSVSTRRELRHEQETTHFAAVDWLMLIGVAVTWGASFLLIEVGLEHFAPTLVAFGRIAFGALALGAFPAARRPVPRGEWPLIAAMGVTWMAVPFVLFAVAQQWIDSSLAGMINAATPLFVAIVAAGAVRQLPTRMQAVGLIVGFAGVVAISLPSVGSGSNALGIVLVLLAAFLYGFAFNIAAPLQRRHGALPVIWRAQLVAAVLVLPFAVVGATESTFGWSSLLAVVGLGALGTGLAFFWFTTLIGRVGSTRGSVAIYLVPVVAILLGASLNDEPVHAAALLGTTLVLAGAYVTSRPRRSE